MISIIELLSNQAKFEDLEKDIQTNLTELHRKVNLLRSAYGKSMIVTSGLRTKKHHLDIYARKGIFPPKVPMKSNHLFGRAVDFADGDGKLKAWVLENIKLIEEIGLYMEDFSATKTWLHVQTNPPKSGKRFFKP
jgi:uncharacterized protein YcbK (DUF882 family)